MRTMDTGWNARLEILRRSAEDKIIEPLRAHGWLLSDPQDVEAGEYLLIEAERAGTTHRVALMYSSATDNRHYKHLATQVEHIFINGQLYKLKSYAYGIDVPVTTVDDFHGLLLKWNAESSVGRFAPGADEVVVEASRSQDRRLLSETPIEAVWLRLRQLHSTTLARKAILNRVESTGAELDREDLDTKAEGLAYVLRNASDYFRASTDVNMSQRVLNLYYGSLAFASAEMLAAPAGAKTLAEIEGCTKQGHGLGMIDGASPGVEDLVVFPVESGFFPRWLECIGVQIAGIPAKKPRRYDQLSDEIPWVTLEQLFSRVPEVGDLFLDIFDSPPGWAAVTGMAEGATRPLSYRSEDKSPPERTYVQFIDLSARLAKEAIATLPDTVSEIIEVPGRGSGRHFRQPSRIRGHSIGSRPSRRIGAHFQRAAP